MTYTAHTYMGLNGFKSYYNVRNEARAWEIAHSLINGLTRDENSTERSGYPVYRSEAEYYNYVCALGDRLEVNTADGNTINIWIDKADLESSEILPQTLTIEVNPRQLETIRSLVCRNNLKMLGKAHSYEKELQDYLSDIYIELHKHGRGVLAAIDRAVDEQAGGDLSELLFKNGNSIEYA